MPMSELTVRDWMVQLTGLRRIPGTVQTVPRLSSCRLVSLRRNLASIVRTHGRKSKPGKRSGHQR